MRRGPCVPAHCACALSCPCAARVRGAYRQQCPICCLRVALYCPCNRCILRAMFRIYRTCTGSLYPSAYPVDVWLYCSQHDTTHLSVMYRRCSPYTPSHTPSHTRPHTRAHPHTHLYTYTHTHTHTHTRSTTLQDQHDFVFNLGDGEGIMDLFSNDGMQIGEDLSAFM